jgi:hypothetical protein
VAVAVVAEQSALLRHLKARQRVHVRRAKQSKHSRAPGVWRRDTSPVTQ